MENVIGVVDRQLRWSSIEGFATGVDRRLIGDTIPGYRVWSILRQPVACPLRRRGFEVVEVAGLLLELL